MGSSSRASDSLEDAIKFDFIKAHVDADKFDKEYTYGIRYWKKEKEIIC